MPYINIKPDVVNFGNSREKVKVKVASDLASAVLTIPSWIDASGTALSGTTLTFTDGIASFYIKPKVDYTDKEYGDTIYFDGTTAEAYMPVVWLHDAEVISLSEIVDDILVASPDDSYIMPIDRFKLLVHAKRGLQEMTFDSLRRPRFAEYILDNTGRITKPFDMVNLIRAYYVDDKGKMIAIYTDPKKNYSYSYKRGSDNELILDQGGYPIETTGQTPVPDKTTTGTSNSVVNSYGDYSMFSLGNRKGFEGGVKSTSGQYKIDIQGNAIVFSDVPNNYIVLEYVSDPLVLDQIDGKQELSVPKYFRQAMENWIYWKAIERRRNVPETAKYSARVEYYNEYRKARRRKSSNIQELVQAVKTGRNFLGW